MENLSKQHGGVYEILYYRKNGQGIWLQEEMVAIHNEQGIIVLFLVTFRDITPFKEPLEGQSVMTNLSKFARLAWTITRSRPNTSLATSNSGSGGGSGSNANHNTSLNNITDNAMHSRNKFNRKPRSPTLGSPTGYTSNGYFGGNFYGGGRFTENLPEYRHEPPKTPPHILLHYSTFKVSLILFERLTCYIVYKRGHYLPKNQRPLLR